MSAVRQILKVIYGVVMQFMKKLNNISIHIDKISLCKVCIQIYYICNIESLKFDSASHVKF